MSLPDFVSDIYNRLKGHTYGGLYQLMNPVLLLRDPELIKMVTVKDFEHFLDRQVLINEDAEPLFGKALSNLKGEELLHILYSYCQSTHAKLFPKHCGITGQ
jgi:cytochrome P450 family 9